MLLLRPCYGHISLIPAAFCFIIISEQLCFLISFPSCVFVSFPSFFLVLYWRWKAGCLFNLQYQNKIPTNANKGEVSSRFFFTFLTKDKTTVIFRKVFLLDFGGFFAFEPANTKAILMQYLRRYFTQVLNTVGMFSKEKMKESPLLTGS